MNAIDTNVFAYALDATNPAKQTRAPAFIDGILVWPIMECGEAIAAF